MQTENNGFGRIGGVQVIIGNLITLAKAGHFDVICQGCNCSNVMGGGLAKQIKEVFPDAFFVDREYYNSHHNKYSMMGNYSRHIEKVEGDKWLTILNMYTQFGIGEPSPGSHIALDYTALTLCLRKLNQEYPGKHVGLPWIGGGLAGGSKSSIKGLIVSELYNLNVTIVEYEPARSMASPGLGEDLLRGEGSLRKPERSGGEGSVAGNRGGGVWPGDNVPWREDD